jgi:hypothetical protein
VAKRIGDTARSTSGLWQALRFTALILTFALPVYFLAMVAVFSFYFGVRSISCSLLEGHVQG